MPNAKDRKIAAFQPKGEPKPGRKVSKPQVTEPDPLSSAHKNEEFRNKGIKNSNKGGRS